MYMEHSSKLSLDLKLEDLSIGMTVRDIDLRSILDTYIILANTELVNKEYFVGVITYIGTELTKESTRILLSNSKSYCVYNNSYDLDEDDTPATEDSLLKGLEESLIELRNTRKISNLFMTSINSKPSWRTLF